MECAVIEAVRSAMKEAVRVSDAGNAVFRMTETMDRAVERAVYNDAPPNHWDAWGCEQEVERDRCRGRRLGMMGMPPHPRPDMGPYRSNRLKHEV